MENFKEKYLKDIVCLTIGKELSPIPNDAYKAPLFIIGELEDFSQLEIKLNNIKYLHKDINGELNLLEFSGISFELLREHEQTFPHSSYLSRFTPNQEIKYLYLKSLYYMVNRLYDIDNQTYFFEIIKENPHKK